MTANELGKALLTPTLLTMGHNPGALGGLQESRVTRCRGMWGARAMERGGPRRLTPTERRENSVPNAKRHASQGQGVRDLPCGTRYRGDGSPERNSPKQSSLAAEPGEERLAPRSAGSLCACSSQRSCPRGCWQALSAAPAPASCNESQGGWAARAAAMPGMREFQVPPGSKLTTNNLYASAAAARRGLQGAQPRLSHTHTQEGERG